MAAGAAFQATVLALSTQPRLISVGAYSPGHDPLLDQAVQLYPEIEAFLQQAISDRAGIDDAQRDLEALLP